MAMSTAVNTTNGAPSSVAPPSEAPPSGAERLYAAMEVLVAAEAAGPVPITLLEMFTTMSDEMFPESFRAACTLVGFGNETSTTTVIEYVQAKRSGQFGEALLRMKALVNEPSSPFCMTRGRLGLPPPIVLMGSDTTPSNASNSMARSRAVIRANQLISQHSLYRFDCSQSSSYLEWKFQLLDICNSSDNDPWVRLELLLGCLSSNLSADMRLTLSDELAMLSHRPSECFDRIFVYLDTCFDTFRAIRYIEDMYGNCRMTESESLSAFLSRYQKAVRLYERARKSYTVAPLVLGRDRLDSHGLPSHVKGRAQGRGLNP